MVARADEGALAVVAVVAQLEEELAVRVAQLVVAVETGKVPDPPRSACRNQTTARHRRIPTDQYLS